MTPEGDPVSSVLFIRWDFRGTNAIGKWHGSVTHLSDSVVFWLYRSFDSPFGISLLFSDGLLFRTRKVCRFFD